MCYKDSVVSPSYSNLALNNMSQLITQLITPRSVALFINFIFNPFLRNVTLWEEKG